MPVQVANNVRLRREFGRSKKIIDLPYLIEIQKNSYDLFLQEGAPEDERQDVGLRAVFKSVSQSGTLMTPRRWSMSAIRWESPSMMWTSATKGA